MIFCARALLPVSQPPIEDGAISISRGRVQALGRRKDVIRNRRGPIVDLGDSILLPGLVNAHCHLDYTDMSGQLPPPDVFTDWIKQIMEIKSGWDLEDYGQSWLKGASMLVKSGTTTVADIEAVPELLPRVWNETPLRVFSFLEIIAISGRRKPQEVVHEALAKAGSLKSKRSRAWISPHAPYSTLPEVLRLSARAARKRKWKYTTHVAESALEFEMFGKAAGTMYEWLKRSGRDMTDCGGRTPVEHMERCGALGKNLLAVHANYLGSKDAALLSRRSVSVVHCPRSHGYFAHAPFPLKKFMQEGVNVCLGTDSLATVRTSRRQAVELDMFEEMRALATSFSGLSPKTIVRMATMNGAKALGVSGKIGQLSAGSYADLIAIPLPGGKQTLFEKVLAHPGAVTASMVGGEWALNTLN
jgi:cytosine/adenosine deaminase-related metal-dependent hydrolase